MDKATGNHSTLFPKNSWPFTDIKIKEPVRIHRRLHLESCLIISRFDKNKWQNYNCSECNSSPKHTGQNFDLVSTSWAWNPGNYGLPKFWYEIWKRAKTISTAATVESQELWCSSEFSFPRFLCVPVVLARKQAIYKWRGYIASIPVVIPSLYLPVLLTPSKKRCLLCTPYQHTKNREKSKKKPEKYYFPFSQSTGAALCSLLRNCL